VTYPIKIIHISDIHFSSQSLSLQPIDIKQPLINLINNKVQEGDLAFLILSGDITFGANKSGYTQGDIFFNQIVQNTKLKRKNIITCPGNHDIVNTSFTDFDIFSCNLRNDNTLKFSNTSNHILNYNNISFLTINSSYYLDHTYGLVDIQRLQKLLKKSVLAQNKVAVIHHHFLNLQQDDTSIIRNSYQTIDLLQNYGFDTILHGHQHTKQIYTINGITIKGISSPTEGRSSSNLIGYYEIDEEKNFTVDEYLFSKDTIHNGQMGRYIKQHG
jgi:3',5'-cyclic AMP phosphodiesterase CpdA